jgi:hypothetical protein
MSTSYTGLIIRKIVPLWNVKTMAETETETETHGVGRWDIGRPTSQLDVITLTLYNTIQLRVD